MQVQDTTSRRRAIEPGYCECGCGERTRITPHTDRKSGRVQGQPLRYIHGHQARGPAMIPPNPSGLCMCGCGERTLIAKLTRRPIGHVRGYPICYVNGHRARLTPRTPAEERFWRLVDRQKDWECWPYLGGTSPKGYARFMVEPKRYMAAHRFAYELIRGPIPDGLVLDHLCRNPSCCNPWHLDPVPNRINILRGEGIAACEARQTHCKRGHPLSGDNLKINKRGARVCRACVYTRKTSHPLPRFRTECIHGHAFDAQNTYVSADGHRHCRTCQRERSRLYSKRQRQDQAS